jgi:sphingomyelin phosphodiesterase acid-like 3
MPCRWSSIWFAATRRSVVFLGLLLGAIAGLARGLPAAPPAAAPAPAAAAASTSAPGPASTPAPAAASVPAPASAPASGGQGTFVALSDLHFNPFYDPALIPALVRADAARWEDIFAASTVKGLGAYGSDVSFPLLESALAAAARVAPHPDFVLITGDFLGHNFQQLFAQYSPGAGNAALRRFVRKTMRFATARIRRTFPRTPVIAALGNNDSVCGDYELQPDSSFLADLTSLWEPLLGAANGSVRQTFPIGGYFSLPHPTVPHLRMIVLNTVFFSPRYTNGCGTSSPRVDPGARELLWLDRTLRAAARRGDQVWLVYHIPPGIDAYATLGALAAQGETGACASAPVALWRADSFARFRTILARFPGLVKASFAGHTHMDEFRLPDGGGFIRVTPAVSPVFANNPGFAVYSYATATGGLADVRTYELDLKPPGGAEPQWALEYDFREAYGQSAVEESSLRAVQLAIAGDAAVRGRYMSFYPVSSASSSADLAHWKAYWCGAQTFTAADFAACYCPATPSP